jgi:ribosomal-protein-alanine N-acetyltransferase
LFPDTILDQALYRGIVETVMPLHLTIRRAQEADIPSIVTIETEAFPDPWDESTLREALSLYPSTFFVARKDGEVAGFVAGGLEDTGEELYGHIMNLAVAPRFRRQRIGKLLVHRIEQEFLIEGANGVQLEVRITNINAQEFYRHLGYHDVFQIGCYYANDEDARVMMKWFRF